MRCRRNAGYFQFVFMVYDFLSFRKKKRKRNRKKFSNDFFFFFLSLFYIFYFIKDIFISVRLS